MSDTLASARERLDAWRRQGADRLDPMRFHHMDALERRAAEHDGEVRQLLERRLSTLIAAYAAGVDGARAHAAQEPAAAPARTPLGSLVDALAVRASADGDDPFPELPMLGEFRQRWARLRTESQLRQTLEQSPTNAGPLNSGTLVHRSIALMRDIAPGYLEYFIAYVDALSWMEQMGHAAPTAAETPRTPGAGKKRTSRPRARQD